MGLSGGNVYKDLDFDTLVQEHGKTIKAAGAENEVKMAFRIIERGCLAKAPEGQDFEHFLTEVVEEILLEDEISQFEYPATLPKSDAELYNTYKGLVLANCRKILKYGFDIEDAEQEIWTRFCHTNIRQKYLQHGVLKRLPATLTGDVIVDYLGITWDIWETMFSEAVNPPMPLKGNYLDDDAEFKTSDIQELDKSGYFKERPMPRYLPPFACCLQLFEIYLRSAVQNLARNMIRKKERRFSKDQPMTNPHVFLASSSASSYKVARSDSENKESWEDSLTSQYPAADDLCDAHRVAESMEDEEGSFKPSRATVRAAEAQVASSCYEVDSEEGKSLYKETVYQLSLEEIAKEAKKAGLEIHSEEGSMFVGFISQGWSQSEALQYIQRLQNKQNMTVFD